MLLVLLLLPIVGPPSARTACLAGLRFTQRRRAVALASTVMQWSRASRSTRARQHTVQVLGDVGRRSDVAEENRSGVLEYCSLGPVRRRRRRHLLPLLLPSIIIRFTAIVKIWEIRAMAIPMTMGMGMEMGMAEDGKWGTFG